MELFESELLDQNQTALAVQPEPRYQPVATASLPAETNEHGHTWIRTIGLILLGLVLIAAFVLLARWAYHRTHHSNTKNGSSKVSNSTKLSEAADKLAAGSGNSLQNSSPSASAPSSGKTPTPPAAAGNSKITNTGPSDVVTLFVGASLAAAGLHFVISLRRFNKAGV